MRAGRWAGGQAGRQAGRQEGVTRVKKDRMVIKGLINASHAPHIVKEHSYLIHRAVQRSAKEGPRELDSPIHRRRTAEA